jgi:hypothetical protein
MLVVSASPLAESHRDERRARAIRMASNRIRGLNLDELSSRDATTQANLVRRRKLIPPALVDAAIARSEATR